MMRKFKNVILFMTVMSCLVFITACGKKSNDAELEGEASNELESELESLAGNSTNLSDLLSGKEKEPETTLPPLDDNIISQPSRPEPIEPSTEPSTEPTTSEIPTIDLTGGTNIDDNKTAIDTINVKISDDKTLTISKLSDSLYDVSDGKETKTFKLDDGTVKTFDQTEIMSFLAETFVLENISSNNKLEQVNLNERALTVVSNNVLVSSVNDGGSIITIKNTNDNYLILAYKRTDVMKWAAIFDGDNVMILMPTIEASSTDYEKEVVQELANSDELSIKPSLIYPVATSGDTQTYWIKINGNYRFGTNADNYRVVFHSFNKLNLK